MIRAERRISFVQGAHVVGAVEEYLLDLINATCRDQAVQLILPDVGTLKPLRDSARAAGAEIAVTPVRGGSQAWHIARALRAFRPDLVHINDVYTIPMLSAAAAVPGPSVVTFHTPELRPRRSWRGRVWWTVARRTCDAWVTTSERDRQTATALWGIPLDRTTAIPYGLRPAWFRPPDLGAVARVRARHDIQEDAVVLGTVARLVPQKNHPSLLRAFQRAASENIRAHLLVVGDGPLRAQLEAQAAASSVGRRIHFAGARSDVIDYLDAMDVFVLNSLFEGRCYAVLEAMARCIPVVATEVGGIPESIAAGPCGLLISPGDEHGLVNAMVDLMADGQKRRTLGVAGRARAESSFTLTVMADATRGLYDRILSEA